MFLMVKLILSDVLFEAARIFFSHKNLKEIKINDVKGIHTALHMKDKSLDAFKVRF